MENEIIKILNSGRALKPAPEFIERSRRLILANFPKHGGFWISLKRELTANLKFGLALTLASFLIFMIMGGVLPVKNILSRTNTTLSGADLLAEVEKLNFQIQLGEAEYLSASAQEIAAILQELENSDSEINSRLDKNIF